MVASIPTSRPPSARSESRRSGGTRKAPLDDDQVERTERFCAQIERSLYDGDVFPVGQQLARGVGCAWIRFERDDLGAHCSQDCRAISRPAADIEGPVALHDGHRLEHLAKRGRGQQASALRPERRRLAIEVGKFDETRGDERLSWHGEEGGENFLVHHVAGAQLTVHHAKAARRICLGRSRRCHRLPRRENGPRRPQRKPTVSPDLAVTS